MYIHIYIIYISEERVWSPQCFCWLECAQCVYSWTRTLLGGLWDVHNFCDTCTSSVKRAQLLENVHNISDTCTTSLKRAQIEYVMTLGGAVKHVIPIYIYIYYFLHTHTHVYMCAPVPTATDQELQTRDFSCASSLVLVIATTCWQGSHKASSNTKKLKLFYNICIYRRRNTTFTRLFLNNEMSLSLTGLLMCVMRSCAMQQPMFASSAQKRSFSFALLFVKYFVLTKTYDCLY